MCQPLCSKNIFLFVTANINGASTVFPKKIFSLLHKFFWRLLENLKIGKKIASKKKLLVFYLSHDVVEKCHNWNSTMRIAMLQLCKNHRFEILLTFGTRGWGKKVDKMVWISENTNFKRKSMLQIVKMFCLKD